MTITLNLFDLPWIVVIFTNLLVEGAVVRSWYKDRNSGWKEFLALVIVSFYFFAGIYSSLKMMMM